MADWYKKTGDTSFPFRCQLSWEGGYADLATASVKLRYKLHERGSTAAEIEATVEDASERIVYALFEPGVPGTYHVEWEITWADTTTTTFPDDEYLIIEVINSLEPAS